MSHYGCYSALPCFELLILYESLGYETEKSNPAMLESFTSLINVDEISP